MDGPWKARKEKLLKAPTEAQDCIQLLTWWRSQYPSNHPYHRLLHHSPNEGKRSAFSGYFLKKMGMQVGWPDFQLAVPSPEYPGLFIEMKRITERKKPLPASQISMHRALRQQGYLVFVCYGFNEAHETIESYLGQLSQKTQKTQSPLNPRGVF